MNVLADKEKHIELGNRYIDQVIMFACFIHFVLE